VRAPTAPGLGVELDRAAILDASLARFGAADE
jgi:hypothetical protein